MTVPTSGFFINVMRIIRVSDFERHVETRTGKLIAKITRVNGWTWKMMTRSGHALDVSRIINEPLELVATAKKLDNASARAFLGGALDDESKS